MEAPDDLAPLLAALRAGDAGAFDALFAQIYDELRGVAHRQLERLGPAPSLGTTGLVHEVYLKLVASKAAAWADRAHFFAVAATAMRHILVDRARRRLADKRGAGAGHDSIADLEVASPAKGPEDLLALDAALTRLQAVSPRLVRVVDLRFFGGLSVEEAAEVLAVTPRTVDRDWRKARAFLYRALAEGSAPPATGD